MWYNISWATTGVWKRHGTTSVVLDAGGAKVAESRHYPYGGERWSSGAMPSDYRWTGQRSESSLGLYQMGARFYDPSLGRWLSADTLVPEPGDPQAFNRYSWVRNNPLRNVDPTGHIEEDEVEDALDIVEQLLAYGVQTIIDWARRGDGTWHEGLWELTTLEAVLQGVQDFAKAIGGQESFEQVFSHGLQFRRESVSEFTPLAGAETLHRVIAIFDRGVNLQDFAGLKSTIVHELAHAWDQETDNERSIEFERATGGTTRFGNRQEIYNPGGWVPDPRAVNRREDWAYSTQALIYDLGVNLNNDRYIYMTSQFQGIQRDQYHKPGR